MNPRPPVLESLWIETDSYDRAAFRELCADSPSLRDLIASGANLLPHFDGFALDLFAVLFKLNVVLREPAGASASAGFFRVLFRITIPALLPLLVVAGMFTALLVFGDMTVVALTTRGGPGYATQLLPYWAYLKGIEGGALSEGAAVALFMFPVLLAGAVLALRMAYRADSN